MDEKIMVINSLPKVSVLIPVYNVEIFLEDSISSLLNQTLKDIELICVNDGSTDNSLEILNKFAAEDSRVKVFNKENGGCGSARNKALDEASGEYIYFFDPDDYVLPNALEELYANAISNDSDLVMFKIARFYEGQPVDYSRPFYNLDEVFMDVDFNHFTFNYKDIIPYVMNSALAPWSKLYKKEFLDKYDDFRFDVGIAFDDVPFHVKTILRAERISFAPDFYYHYRTDNPNSVNNTPSNAIDIMRIIDMVEEFIVNEGHYDELKDEFFYFKVNHIVIYIVSSHSEEYYKLAKKKFLDFDYDDIKHIGKRLLGQYDMIINSENYQNYLLLLKIKELENSNKVLKSKNKNLISKNKKLVSENKKLTTKNKKLSKISKELQSSNSWKVTKPLRKLNHIVKK